MAKITEEDLLILAQLSRLHFEKDELKAIGADIESILGYVEQLQKVDLKDHKPTYQVTGLKNVMRNDSEFNYGVSAKELLKNAPDQENGYIKVRRVLE